MVMPPFTINHIYNTIKNIKIQCINQIKIYKCIKNKLCIDYILLLWYNTNIILNRMFKITYLLSLILGNILKNIQLVNALIL